jgi:hypothetical protein
LISDPALKMADIVTVRADVHDLILKDGELIGPESDDPLAHSFLRDFGLNAFVAVLSANVGPKVISALGGDTILWLALIGSYLPMILS